MKNFIKFLFFGINLLELLLEFRLIKIYLPFVETMRIISSFSSS